MPWLSWQWLHSLLQLQRLRLRLGAWIRRWILQQLLGLLLLLLGRGACLLLLRLQLLLLLHPVR